MSFEVISSDEYLFGDGTSRVGTLEATRVSRKILSVDSKFMALEVGLEVEGA